MRGFAGIGLLWTLLAGILFQSVVSAARTESPQAARPVDFNREIRPILSDICYTCHGPDDNQRKAGLRLDTKEGAFGRPGVITPGDAGRSKLYQRIADLDPDSRMPPSHSGRKLTENQIDLLRRWIDEGAAWQIHWAYVPPRRPDPPVVRQRDWPRNPIDNFILARLEREGLRASPEADRATLLRRVTLDLTGLPPVPAEIDAFLADRSADAFEKRVDQLLSSPRYGERMTMQWMDLARYADTHGYHIDSHRDMWPWRDWVIRAFNQNMPFDRFTIAQLAGDLLPEATPEQKIATGFNRNHMINFEGGAIPEEYQVEYVVDRVETTAITWMGMTMGCARCHSHKYDPITQKEFYQFFAFFNTVPEKGLDGRTGNAEPLLPLPSHEQKQRQDQLSAAIAAAEESLADAKIAPLQAAWEKDAGAALPGAVLGGLTAHYGLDGSLADDSGRYRHGRTVRGDPTFGAGQVGRSVSFDGDSEVSFGDAGSFRPGEAFSLALWVRVNSNVPLSLLHKLDDASSRRGYEIFFEDIGLVGIQHWAARLNVRLATGVPDAAIHLRTRERMSFSDWHHLALAWDGSGKASGLRVFLDGRPAETEIVQDNAGGAASAGAALIVGNPDFGKPYKGQLDDLRFYGRPLQPAEVEQLALHYPVQAILSGVFGKRSKEESDRVREYFLGRGAPEALRQASAELKRLKKEKSELEKQITTVMVMGEMKKPRETFLLGRGNYRNQTEQVQPGVPSALPPIRGDGPLTRLSLASWLVDPGHPLTARVTANRFWQMCFGTGIVKTSEDFGSQGEPPVHPELLDWLATEFVRTGWDVKGMMRLIVTSAAYRQSSRATPELLEKDPENRLLARGPRFRMPAEMVRDSALAAGGLLNGDIGGRGVFPYQPKGLWEEMAFGDGFSAQEYRQSTGRDLYRRSMYTFWKRTVPYPSLTTFDAPDREKCTARRLLTNTPLQALVLMNDPTYVEAARALAERALREGGRSPGSRVSYAFRLATARAPTAAESRVLLDLLSRQQRRYRGDRDAALKLLRVGEMKRDDKLDVAVLAAWTTVASAILNLDETITKE